MTTTHHSFKEVANIPTGAVFACPTDTVYGLSCLATDSEAVLKIKKLKGKGAHMPVIVLIANLAQLDMFVRPENISRKNAESRILGHVWPGPVSVVFADALPQWQAISPDQTLAIRMPQRSDLCAFIEKFGPIVSTSANLSGGKPAISAREVLEIFPTQLDFVIDGGECNNPPSTLIKILR
jgi:L-threonylcarbamoyladenylate synthase